MRELFADMNTILVYALLFVITLVAAYILLALHNTFKKEETQKKKKSPRLGCIVSLILLLTAIALFSTTAYLRAFHAFTKQQLVAFVQCRPTPIELADFELVFIPVVDGVQQQPYTFPLKGDQWTVEGDILKWENMVNFVGLHTMYRLNRVAGRYSDVKSAQSKQVTPYTLVAGQNNGFWRFLYNIGERLPLIESVYGNSVYSYPAYGYYYKIYVTTSGFSTEKKSKQGDTLMDEVANELEFPRQ
jgi:NADH:ubiquinone oxidoreductase subunit 5 (subunit L)/multisubunit Na+/H+ antiporter MnhA subunit